MVLEKVHRSHEFGSLPHGATVKVAVQLEAGVPQQIAIRRCAFGGRFRCRCVAARRFGGDRGKVCQATSAHGNRHQSKPRRLAISVHLPPFYSRFPWGQLSHLSPIVGATKASTVRFNGFSFKARETFVRNGIILFVKTRRDTPGHRRYLLGSIP